MNSVLISVLFVSSSYRPHTQTEEYKAKKKERVKEYLKELKSMIQPKGGRMGTLSTLQHVLSRMRKIKGKIHLKRHCF